MDVFALRDRLVDEYQQYVSGFITIKEPRTRRFVDDVFAAGHLWPEPLVQINPAFKQGPTIDQLVANGALHPECATIFRRREEPETSGHPITLHWHQYEAIQVAATGQSYVLTTGTGSGKSLAYFIPIVDYLLKHGPGHGIKAIVVYPMNALCNSQAEALERFLEWGYPGGSGPVRFARYTGQEDDARRRAISAHPPDILLTNFVMLELILTRQDELPLVKAAEGLEFLVLDELHTYRGRQGADVAMLARRVRERLGAPTLRYVGTSATVAGAGTREEQQRDVAAATSRLFGIPVPPENVIGETLRRATTGPPPAPAQLAAALHDPRPLPTDFRLLAEHPLAIWAETAFGLQEDAQGRLERRNPRTLSEVAADLSQATSVARERCANRLRELLLAGTAAVDPHTGFPLFAFRLHQFISRGDTIYASPEPVEQRYLSAERQQYVPGDRQRRLYPLAFCRSCGQDYLIVSLQDGRSLAPRDLDERPPSPNAVAGYLILHHPDLLNPADDPTVLPEDWLEARRNGFAIKAHARKYVPFLVHVTADGQVSPTGSEHSHPAWFMPAPFCFCFSCGINYASTREKEFFRLAGLSSEGRSTATTILSLSTIRALREDPTLPKTAKKLLSFTDNRQDASLQAGHFNDFVQVTLLRAAILAAVDSAGEVGLTHDEIASRVVEKLALDITEYATNPSAQFAARRQIDAALRDVVGYRVYHDLRRGWRISSPNLEQVGLLQITYDDLDALCADESVWQDLHPILAAATPQQRVRACSAILDFARRTLAIKVPYLDESYQAQIKSKSYQHLRPPWAFDENERLQPATTLFVGSPAPSGVDGANLSTRSLLGRFLRRGETWPNSLGTGVRLPEDQFDGVVTGLVTALVIGGHLEPVPGLKGGYRLQAAVIRWRRGAGEVQPDLTRTPRPPPNTGRVNEFFATLYQLAADQLHHLEAREHTAQVPTAQRKEREERFGQGDLPVLYCSPTMELGVDIRDLNAVNMRNVPPTPANYAQRSGRAGRSGQAALVINYCTSTSVHDQYYFRRPERMVFGAVAPPRVDLANEELIRAHLHAVWLAETGVSLGRAVSDLLDLTQPELPLKSLVKQEIADVRYQRRTEHRARQILATLAADLTPERAPWYSDDWLTETVRNAPLALDRAADRWRHLYRSAKAQQDQQHQIVADPTRTAEERRQAQRLREEAETQLELLTRARDDVYSDFYSYRYFATEGFLPGYNFPRLPVTAYIPGRQRPHGGEEYLSRPRFIALSEFGPRTIIYHEGSRYRVTRVVLPREESGSRTRSARFCRQCGYGHFADRLHVDRCDNCNVLLDGTTSRKFDNLLRLESVSTRRVDRITCDEEERVRLGYELQTIYRFAHRDGAPATTRAVFSTGTTVLASGTYGPATTLWRVNLGWVRRQDPQQFGFHLDMEAGTWEKSSEEPDATSDDDDPLTPRSPVERVIPFVEDTRNVFVLRLENSTDAPTLLSLMYALKRGIEAHYQLEDSELAAEPLPDAENPCQILFYEASEGGAGVLVRLTREPGALAAVAREALAVCHFDPATGVDLRRAPRAREECEAACYDCLLSYNNQRYHAVLDRQLVAELLTALSRVTGVVGAGAQTRAEQRDRLLRLCQSELERSFVRWLDRNGYRLPDDAQVLIENASARPDFVYDDPPTCVYVDGPVHADAERHARDANAVRSLESMGFTVVRVQGPETWRSVVGDYPWIFGSASEPR